jgi:HEAT repeat protein
MRSRRHGQQPEGERKRGVDELLALLSDPDPKVRSNAAGALWERSDDLSEADRARCIAALEPLAIGDPDPLVKTDAIEALVELDAPGAVDLALAALQHPDSTVREMAVGCLVGFPDPRVVGALLPLLQDRDGDVRVSAAIALGVRGDPAALEPLRAMVQRERRSWQFWRGDPVMRQAVRRAGQEAISRIEMGQSPSHP